MIGRVAILATPRSDNTWLRRLLALSFGLSYIAVHRPGDVDWDGLPRGAALQSNSIGCPALRSSAFWIAMVSGG